MAEQENLHPLYHLTNISNCVKILQDGELRPHCIADGLVFGHMRDSFAPDNYVHFNFCPRSVMLFKAKQDGRVGETKFYGQEDAVHIRLPSFSQLCLQMDLNPIIYKDTSGKHMIVSNAIIMSDMDCSWFKERKLIPLVDQGDDCLMQHLDELSLKKENAWQPNEIRSKSAELLIAPRVKLSWCIGYEIGVYNDGAKQSIENKLLKANVNTTSVNISVRPEWYF